MARIGSFIMEYARNHLMRMKHAISKMFGPKSICYSDTDSVVVSFDNSPNFNNEGRMFSIISEGVYDTYR
jgi:hypothetical protein